MTRTIGIAVVGMGWMGQAHSRAYLRVRDHFHDDGINARLVIVADPVAARRREACARFGFVHETPDWQEAVSHPEVEVVVVATPNADHATVSIATARAGRHLFCEKPAGRSVDEALAIATAVHHAEVQSGVGFNYRCAPMVQYAASLIRDGHLGTITHYRSRFFAMYGSDPLSQLSWRFDREAAGLGVLGDLMPHVVDMARYLLGPIARVTATTQTQITKRPIPIPGQGTHFTRGHLADPSGPVTNEDDATALITFASGVHGVLDASRVIFGPKCEFGFEVFGTRGAVRWNFERMNECEVYLPDASDSTNGSANRAHDGFVRVTTSPDYAPHGRFNPAAATGLGYDDLKTIEAGAFLRRVHGQTNDGPTIDDAVAAARFAEAADRSAKHQGWEDVPA